MRCVADMAKSGREKDANLFDLRGRTYCLHDNCDFRYLPLCPLDNRYVTDVTDKSIFLFIWPFNIAAGNYALRLSMGWVGGQQVSGVHGNHGLHHQLPPQARLWLRHHRSANRVL